LAQIVITDDAFGLAESSHLVSDVYLDVEVIESRDNSVAHQHEPLVFGAGPASAIGGPAKGGDHRAGTVGQQAFEVGSFAEEVEPQFDQLRPLLGGFLDLGLYHLVAGAANDRTG